MLINERSYAGEVFRPRPELHHDDALGLVIVATPWGHRESAQKAIRIISEYLNTAKTDDEATSPFARLSCLSDNANHLRIAIQLANNALYREDNREEYITGVELFALLYTPLEVSWVQLGHPFPTLVRPRRGLIPLGQHFDLAMDVSRSEELLPPLPGTLLGLDSSSNITVGSFLPHPQDRLILISRSQVPSRFYALPTVDSLDQITEMCAQESTQLAFWLGLIELSSTN